MAAPNLSGSARAYLNLSRGLRWVSGHAKPLAPVMGKLQYLAGALWLGLLDADQLTEVTRAHYDGRSGFDDQRFNLQNGLYAWEAEAVQTQFAGQRRVLLACAGGGREVIALGRLGFEVTGFDFSPTLVAACRRNVAEAGLEARILDAPGSGVPALDDSDIFDALFIGRGAYHHMPGRVRRIEFLRACRRAIKDGAPVILSGFHTRPAQSKSHDRTQAIANAVRRLCRRHDRVEVGDWLSVAMQHAFVREEVEQEFADAGMTLDVFAVSPSRVDGHMAYVSGRARART